MAFSNPCPPSTIRQYAVLEQHRREQVYNIAGNHDASPFGAPTSEGREVNWWFRKWADPIGEQSGVDPAKRPYPIDGTWERYTFKVENHGPDGAPEGASYLYFVDDKPKAQAFESYLAAHPGAIDLWLGGHTHTHPDDVLNGRSHVERKWGVNFVNCAQLSNSTPT